MRIDSMRSGRAKDIVLIGAVVDYISDSVREQDTQTVRRLGLRHDQLRRISEMTQSERTQLALLCQGGHFVRLAIDPSALDDLLRYVDENLDQAALLQDCIAADAPKAMMAHFFHMSKTEYAKQRHLYNKGNSTGRTRQATDEEATGVYDWLERMDDEPTAKALLDIHTSMGIDLRIVWEEFNRIRRPDIAAA